MPSKSSELWFDDIGPLEDFRATVRSFLVRPERKVDPDLANTVLIHSAGPDRLAAIRVLSDLGNLSLQEAKSFLDSLPKRLRVESTEIATRKLERVNAVIEYERESEWTTYPIDRGLFSAVELTLADNVELWAHVHVTAGGARGVISVLPSGQTFPMDYQPPKSRVEMPPMESYITGDETPESYLRTSLLIRELWEVGAEWHGVAWKAHGLIVEPPQDRWRLEPKARFISEILTERYGKQFRFKDMRPRVFVNEQGVAWVDFFTLDPVGTRRIVFHTDAYTDGVLVESETYTHATGDRGYVH